MNEAQVNDTTLLYLRVISPKKLLFEGNVRSISSINSSGKFDILPFHANFISFIEEAPIKVIKEDNTSAEFTFPFAIIYTSQNKVSIFTDIYNLNLITMPTLTMQKEKPNQS